MGVCTWLTRQAARPPARQLHLWNQKQNTNGKKNTGNSIPSKERQRIELKLEARQEERHNTAPSLRAYGMVYLFVFTFCYDVLGVDRPCAVNVLSKGLPLAICILVEHGSPCTQRTQGSSLRRREQNDGQASSCDQRSYSSRRVGGPHRVLWGVCANQGATVVVVLLLTAVCCAVHLSCPTVVQQLLYCSLYTRNEETRGKTPRRGLIFIGQTFPRYAVD